MFTQQSPSSLHLSNQSHFTSALTTDIRHFWGQSNILDDSFREVRSHSANEIRLVPPQKKLGGLSQAQWGDMWWQWAYSLPHNGADSVHPFYDDHGVGTLEGQPIAQDGLVYNLVGSYNSQPIGENGFLSTAVRGDFSAENRIFIRDDQYIFAPVLNVINDNQVWTTLGLPADTFLTEIEFRRLNNSFMKTAMDLFLEINEDPLIERANGWKRYRQVSPASGFSFTPSENSILNSTYYPVGESFQSFSDGYWFMLNPLPVGEHTIHFGGNPLPVGEYTIHFGGMFNTSILNVDIDGDPTVKTPVESALDAAYGSGLPGARFELDITYKITVVPSNCDITALAE